MTTTMQFGPEWMRTKHQTPRTQPPPSPPPSHAPPSSASTYSALVSPAPPPPPEKRDESHPFRYSKEEMLRIYKEGGGRGGLGLEVERWEGVVREIGNEPVGLRDMDEGEKKLFAGPLNSDLRRRQSTDYLSPLNTSSLGGERPRINQANPATGSPMRERFGSFMGRRRDSTDQPPSALPRKLSLSSVQGPLASPRESSQPSPRPRGGATPGFDGVLSGPDSWIARRRASEGLSKPGGAVARGEAGVSEHPPDAKGEDIKEEDEDERNLSIDPKASGEDSSSTQLAPSNTGLETQRVSQTFSGLTIATGQSHGTSSEGTGGTDSTAAGPPQGLPDLTSVEWSYLDPQGQVQGPFLADLMQKWYDEGYFTPDLLMKRTHVDTEWIPVGELGRRAGSEKIFLSLPIPSAVPPGLPRRSESPLQTLQDQNTYSDPYQPIPTRSVRTSAFDSYLGSASNPSDSPSSSFGAGRFSNSSPDPGAFGGRVGSGIYATGDPSGIARGGAYPTGPEPSSAFGGPRRSTLNESSLDPSLGARSSSFGNISPGRAGSIDSYGFNGTYNPNQVPWSASSIGHVGSGFDSMTPGRGPADPMGPFQSNYGAPGHGPGSNQGPGFGNHRGPHESAFGDSGAGSNALGGPEYGAVGELGVPRDGQPLNRSPMDDRLPESSSLGFNNTYANGFGGPSFGGQNQGQPFPPSPIHYSRQQHPQGAAPANVVGQHLTASPKATSLPPTHLQNTLAPSAPASQSPWNTPEPAPIRRPGPFDPPHPTSANTVVNSSTGITPLQPPPWGRTGQTSRPTSQTNEMSPWYAASQEVVDNGWKEIPGPNSLTFSNVGEHNQLQQQQELSLPVHDSAVQIIDIASEAQQHARPSLVESTVSRTSASAIAPPQHSKSRRKSTTAQPNVSKPPAPVTDTEKAPSPPPLVQTKPAWSSEEDTKKAKPSGVALGLREIQEAEAKKLEARKAAERERERAARAAAPAATEDVQSFTASWGLPTSQAGARGATSPRDGHGTTSSSPVTSVPVWTSTAKSPPTKKTMKEIQEEEERRKKTAVKETTAAAAARRAHADTTTKTSSPVQSGGSAWTTVGASGKSSAQTVPARPPIAPSTSTTSVAGSPSGARVANGQTAPRQPTAVPAKTAPARVDDVPVTPSHEFLKWLSESLKGLNSSVNFEEIMSMLLQFPMDPPPSTVELISDLIYASSTTLDGRRFASEFVSKRKADAASRAKNGSTSGTAAKPVSIADVVKAQPKPSQPEWGGFKVVNKKKKGGRS